MKGLLLAGTIMTNLFGQNWSGGTTDINQLLGQMEQQLLQYLGTDSQSMPSDTELHNLIQNTVNQMYDAGVKQKIRQHHLPTSKPNQTQQIQNIELAAGDRSVSSTVMAQTESAIQSISIPILKGNVGLPQKNVQIVLYSSSRTYANALAKAGMPRNEINKFTKGTQGLTVDNAIWIPLYNLEDKSELANVITHELTHAVLNEEGVGDTVPVWVNEGLAWHNGMLAKTQVSKGKALQLQDALNEQIATVARAGELLPLSASEDDIVGASYTVEWVDYLAVDNLIKQYGIDTFLSFLQNIPNQGVDQAFSQQYGESPSQFEQEFYDNLVKSQ